MTYAHLICKLIFLSVSILVSTSSHALEVNPDSGTVTYTSIDCISDNGGKQLYVERFFNSSAKQSGWFGFGHGSQFETYVVMELDETLSVHEYGQSTSRIFTSVSRQASAEDMVRLILEKRKIYANETMKKRLLQNRTLRSEIARELGLVSRPDEGEVFISNDFDGENIIFKDNQFIRTLKDGKVLRFTAAGRLSEISESRRNHSIKISYDDLGRAKTISDNHSNQLTLSWDPYGKVSEILSGSNGRRSKYSYREGLLEKVVNQENEVFAYEFDGRLNLTKVSYPGQKNPLTIEYNAKTRRPREVIYPDRSKVEYNFSETRDDRNIRTKVLEKRYSATGEIEGNLSWSYVHTIGSQGEKRLVSKVYDDGFGSLTTTFRPCCYPQPGKILRGGRSVTFEYDALNRLIEKKHSDGRKLRISYNPHGHISNIDVNGTSYAFTHHPLTAELLAVQGPGYQLNLNMGNGVLRKASYTLDADKMQNHVEYTYDKAKRLSAISVNKKLIVQYKYTGNERTEHFASLDRNAGQSLLRSIDKMMVDAMVLREVNYTF